jgi:hypothetical protein
MKSFNLTTRQALLALTLAVSASAAFAGDMAGMRMLETASAMPASNEVRPTRLPCNNPTTLTINSPTSGPATFDPTDFLSSQIPALGSPIFHQTTANKQFAYTFKFKLPEGCCEVSAGKMTVYYRAIQGGSSNNSSDSGNDAGGPIRHGYGLGGGQLYSQFPVIAGSTLVKTYTIPAGWMASGRVSLSAEDDTAVDHISLTAQMCCVHDTPAIR